MAEDYNGEQAKRWRSDYAGWIRAIRGKYPHAHILLTTTIMAHSPAWDDAIEEVFSDFGDPKVHHFLYPKNGCGTPGHVRANEAAEMAKRSRRTLKLSRTSGRRMQNERTGKSK